MKQSFTLKEIFNAIEYVPQSVIAVNHKGDNVLTYPHVEAIIKRFAADDAAVYRVLSGEIAPPSLMQPFKAIAKNTDKVENYFDVYEKSEADPKTSSPHIALNDKIRIDIDQGCGYMNTVYLIKLIEMAQDCRKLLAPNFPEVSEEARGKLIEFAARLDATQRERFPLFESEAIALKNLAMPINPMDPLLENPGSFRVNYIAAFDHLVKRPESEMDRIIGKLIKQHNRKL